ncbi:MAG: hypothetical protein AAFQ83_13370 [Bacteroidota bacterium]
MEVIAMENRRKIEQRKKALKNKFRQGKIPQEGDFANLIDHLIFNIEEEKDKVLIPRLQVEELSLKVTNPSGQEGPRFVNLVVEGNKVKIKEAEEEKEEENILEDELISLEFTGDKIWETLMKLDATHAPFIYRITGKIFNPSTLVNHVIFHAIVTFLGVDERNNGIEVIQSGQKNGIFSRRDFIRIKWEEKEDDLYLLFKSNQELKGLRLVYKVESLWDDRVTTVPRLTS